ncbi:hypothetical protein, conserved [Entamoeba dispar SAW760]|uniref:Non-canonical E2 ubiquitin-conjugating enzyme C-terminal domain-containing protein n=1 Tax=Entamoeba dispar (strain ATCC PRA-260 / SAW760) TaxID=370354 RepID=B0EMD7_ENTDS|nr:uncharacterized protein EDI_070970 [Entamoeba dispar SAW760]EDR24355.1 hypothetical protein, conserved [Entamoeba dispar SAW760]|eukprot:EDR24355.1 hypothetical protein, conserved [Entamoeba dispar SAW760]
MESMGNIISWDEDESRDISSYNEDNYIVQGNKIEGLIEEGDENKYEMTYREHLMKIPDVLFKHYIKYHPMRLNEKERILLEVLESALDVSEYTDNVDIARSDYGMYYFGSYSYYSQRDVSINKRTKQQIIKEQHQELKQIIIGLLMGNSYRDCIKLLHNPTLLEECIQNCFEVGRRFKISNPHLMRTTYQKMMHILQDAILYNPSFIGPEFEQTKKFKEILTVGLFAKENQLEDVFNEPNFRVAVLPAVGSGTERENARKEIIKKYGGETERMLLSISDGFASAASMCGVVHQMLHDLKKGYQESTKLTDLTIKWGVRGSRISHSHSEQFIFVSQSLTLWWNVMQNMPLLWNTTDKEFLSGSNYSLVNTGQGLQRMQSAPNVSGVMHQILANTKQKLCNDGWRGLSVVHMGDQDVPNCLFFIDKYSQVPWIVAPIVKTTTRIIKDNNKRLDNLFTQYTREQWSTLIYRDFFQHGFDGSGSDGGSCIDGRLTSAWNWCSMIERYIFYPFFLVTDFEGFEGPYKK